MSSGIEPVIHPVIYLRKWPGIYHGIRHGKLAGIAPGVKLAGTDRPILEKNGHLGKKLDNLGNNIFSEICFLFTFRKLMDGGSFLFSIHLELI